LNEEQNKEKLQKDFRKEIAKKKHQNNHTISHAVLNNIKQQKLIWPLFILRNKYLLVNDFIVHGKCKSLNDICTCSKKLAMNLAD